MLAALANQTAISGRQDFKRRPWEGCFGTREFAAAASHARYPNDEGAMANNLAGFRRCALISSNDPVLLLQENGCRGQHDASLQGFQAISWPSSSASSFFTDIRPRASTSAGKADLRQRSRYSSGVTQSSRAYSAGSRAGFVRDADSGHYAGVSAFGRATG
jgi:hypothetical protein